jgi:TRAP-type C4-dicarboxylate transport system permease small subunit
MRLVLKTIDAICLAGAVVAALAIAVIAAMLIVEVVVTSRFGWSQPWVVEYSGYGLAAALFAGSGWALRQDGHIRVTILFQALPDGLRRVVDILCTLAALAITVYAARALVIFALRSAELGSVSTYVTRTPLVYPQALLAASFVILALALTGRLIRLFAGLPTEAPVPSVTTDSVTADKVGAQ